MPVAQNLVKFIDFALFTVSPYPASTDVYYASLSSSTTVCMTLHSIHEVLASQLHEVYAPQLCEVYAPQLCWGVKLDGGKT
jgi:hypothetical protein